MKQKQWKSTGLVNVDKNERLISLLGGMALVAYGLLRLKISTVLLLVSGGYLLYRGITGHCFAFDLLDINRAIDWPQQTATPRSKPTQETPAGITAEDKEDDVIEASLESFPASDPPAWTMG